MLLPDRQRGAALLILLALFATAAAYMLVSSLNKGSVALSLAKADKNRQVMQEAKAALIAWAASETSQPASGQGFQPGALPCPDRNNDGYAESSCSSGVNQLGRLPYKTLGISDLRDTSGEILWYALSSNFSRNTSNVINSDKQGTLSIGGQSPASNVIAIVIAPGMRLGSQDRSSTGVNTAANYLENLNSSDSDYNTYYSAAENLTDPVVANLFNDQLLAITHQDLFSVVEPVVAARIERDIVRQFIYDPSDAANTAKYFSAWGAFPFAAPFESPASSSFTGQASPAMYEGLLPVYANFAYNWNLPAFVTPLAAINSFACSIVVLSALECTIKYPSNTATTVTIAATVNDVGRAFVQIPKTSDVTADHSLSNVSISGGIDSAGVGTVNVTATLPSFSASNGNGIKVTIQKPVVSAITSTISTEFAGWFNNNQWYRLTYYAVSPGYIPGGTRTCNAASTPMCISVSNLTAPNDNKQAIVVLAGRSLSGASRPNGTLSDYLEAKNASTGDYSFEHGVGKTTTVAGPPVAISAINDRVIVIAP